MTFRIVLFVLAWIVIAVSLVALDVADAQLRRRTVVRDVAPVPVVTLPTVSGQTVQLPDGDVTLTTPLRLADLDKATLRGGIHTRLLYAGPPTRAVVEFARCGWCTLRDVDIVVQAPGVDAAVLVTNLPGGTAPDGRVSTANVCERVRVMDSGNGKAAKHGFSVDSYAAGGPDSNNDNHRFLDCQVLSYTESGYYVDGGQAHGLVFNNCYSHDAAGRGGIGLWAKGCVYFEWHGGGATANDCDFRLGWPPTKATIDQFDGEQSKQFLVTDHFGDAWPISMTGVRWDGLPVAGVPVIDCYGGGPVTLRSSTFGGINGVCPTFRFDGWSGPGLTPGSVDLFGVLIRQHGGTMPTGPIATCPVRWEVRSTGFRYQQVTPTIRVYKMGQWNRSIQ